MLEDVPDVLKAVGAPDCDRSGGGDGVVAVDMCSLQTLVPEGGKGRNEGKKEKRV